LSGGMSLIPLMKLRFATPSAVIDVNNVPGLEYLSEESGQLRIGALTRNRDIIRSEVVRARYPLMASTAPQIADPLVRGRSTLVGSLCHCDPQGDWGAVMLAMNGEVVAASTSGRRRIAVGDLLLGPFRQLGDDRRHRPDRRGRNEHQVPGGGAGPRTRWRERPHHRGGGRPGGGSGEAADRSPGQCRIQAAPRAHVRVPGPADIHRPGADRHPPAAPRERPRAGVREETVVEVKQITVTVNGEARIVEVEPRTLCVHMIREVIGLTGTHLGCDTTSCGACTVLLDGVPVKSCTLFGVQTDGHEITTVEGLGWPSELHPVQEGFKEEHGLQCGFC